ncbi:group II intron maturase-specific domain-containing protein [Mesorhizobium sp.]|uniref:group II intron maturase-specific domain-containing protein n=1 Tax=Mesorhizobium sp. TaxID=1871066 RepID=UPI0025CE34B9|nr:group II intron maturase-specific domain-containing protein [Mesorhizobium sp.]
MLRIKRKVSDLLRLWKQRAWPEAQASLNRPLAGWAAYFQQCSLTWPIKPSSTAARQG